MKLIKIKITLVATFIFCASLSLHAAEVVCGTVALGCLGAVGSAQSLQNQEAEKLQRAFERLVIAWFHHQGAWLHKENIGHRYQRQWNSSLLANLGFSATKEEFVEKNVMVRLMAHLAERAEFSYGADSNRRRKSLQDAFAYAYKESGIRAVRDAQNAKHLERLALYRTRLLVNYEPVEEKESFSADEPSRFKQALVQAMIFKNNIVKSEQDRNRLPHMRRPSLQKAIGDIDAIVAQKYPDGLDYWAAFPRR